MRCSGCWPREPIESAWGSERLVSHTRGGSGPQGASRRPANGPSNMCDRPIQSSRRPTTRENAAGTVVMQGAVKRGEFGSVAVPGHLVRCGGPILRRNRCAQPSAHQETTGTNVTDNRPAGTACHAPTALPDTRSVRAYCPPGIVLGGVCKLPAAHEYSPPPRPANSRLLENGHVARRINVRPPPE